MKNKIKAFKKEISPLLLKALKDKDIITPLNFDSLIDFIFNDIRAFENWGIQRK